MTRTFDPVQLGSIEMFCKAAELEGFTAAAEALGVTPAAVSRSVGRLEARLGLRLFTRTTRQIRLTEDGRAYYAPCREALAQIDAAQQAITGRQAVPSGLLRISMPTTYGHYRVLPLLPAFAARYPLVQVEVSLSNRNIDFVVEGWDLAVRLGEPRDSRLVAHLLEDAPLGIYAAPSYLKQHGTPTTLAELRTHDCIQFVLPSTGRGMPWPLRDAGRDVDFAFTSRVRVLDDVLGCVTCAVAGGGLFQTYRFIADGYVARRQLKEVMLPHAGRSRPFSLLYPQNRHLSAKVRAFKEFLLRSVKQRSAV